MVWPRRIQTANPNGGARFFSGPPLLLLEAVQTVSPDTANWVVKQQLRLDPFCGAVFVFRARRADRVKLLVWDGSGLTLIYKRLDQARFVWPRIEDGVMRLSPGQLGALFEGLDWKRVHSRRVPRPQLAQ